MFGSMRGYESDLLAKRLIGLLAERRRPALAKAANSPGVV